MVLTKNQVLTFLRKARQNQANSHSAKSISMAFAYLLVKKDLITVADILEEFPELDQTP